MSGSSTSNPAHSVPSIPFPVVTIHYGPTRTKAPASLVFEALTDVSTWKDWNVLVPRCEILKQPTQSEDTTKGKGLSKTKLQLGALIRFHISMGHVPIRMLYTISEISVPDDTDTTPEKPGSSPAYIINWCNPHVRHSWIPSWIIRFERTHEIRVLSDDTCEIETWDCQAGPSAYLVKWLLHKRLSKEFENWVNGLRDYCERECKTQQSLKP